MNISSSPDARPLILLVDDDGEVRKALNFLLDVEGYQVRSFTNGADLLAAGQPVEARCLLANHNMPTMDGISLLAELTARGSTIPMILISGNVTAEMRRRARQLGVIHVVEKPFLDSALLDALHEIIGQP